jgi:hypothetical protein
MSIKLLTFQGIRGKGVTDFLATFNKDMEGLLANGEDRAYNPKKIFVYKRGEVLLWKQMRPLWPFPRVKR